MIQKKDSNLGVIKELIWVPWLLNMMMISSFKSWWKKWRIYSSVHTLIWWWNFYLQNIYTLVGTIIVFTMCNENEIYFGLNETTNLGYFIGTKMCCFWSCKNDIKKCYVGAINPIKILEIWIRFYQFWMNNHTLLIYTKQIYGRNYFVAQKIILVFKKMTRITDFRTNK